MLTVMAFPGQRCPHDIKAERILAEEALAACELSPDMRNRIPLSILNSTRTKEGEPGEPAKPKVDTIMSLGVVTRATSLRNQSWREYT